MLGMGAMLHYLGGGSEHGSDEFYGKQITAARLEDERIKLDFSDGTKIDIWDDGQSCCENRYITTDDKPEGLVGGVLRAIEVKDGPGQQDEYGEAHETAFVELRTDTVSVVFTTHNEHNGYYGGFGLTITTRE